MQSVDFKWVVMAIRIQREVGGNLAELLNTVAATLREREYLRRHVKALSAEGRLSCWILGGLPPVFLLYLTVSKPEYVHPLYHTLIGGIMLVVMVVLLSVGIVWMSKVARVDV
jgi:tight adherence protein B